jgi:YNFM family putative membrane transporter
MALNPKQRPTSPHRRLQPIVFAPVSAAFTNIYITQPVLPVLQSEFGADVVTVSFTVSAVIFGIALANLPFGFLADRVAIQPLILTGGILVATGGLVCALTHDLRLFIGVRFIQGLFIPALTTCLAAYLAKTLPAERLNVVMGSYVAATVLGGLGGRLLGGWIHAPLHWRYAFVSASILIVGAMLIAVRGLPRQGVGSARAPGGDGFTALLARRDLWRSYLCGAGSFSIYSTIFNFLPFRLAGPPYGYSTQATTLLYLVFIVGIFMGPAAGRISNRFGTGVTLMGGAAMLALSLIVTLAGALLAVVVGLLGLCAGFFTVHAAAIGSLNRRLAGGQGKANALYVLFYYLGGWLGITLFGVIYKYGGWGALILGCVAVSMIPLAAGIAEQRRRGQEPRRKAEGRG